MTSPLSQPNLRPCGAPPAILRGRLRGTRPRPVCKVWEEPGPRKTVQCLGSAGCRMNVWCCFLMSQLSKLISNFCATWNKWAQNWCYFAVSLGLLSRHVDALIPPEPKSRDGGNSNVWHPDAQPWHVWPPTMHTKWTPGIALLTVWWCNASGVTRDSITYNNSLWFLNLRHTHIPFYEYKFVNNNSSCEGISHQNRQIETQVTSRDARSGNVWLKDTFSAKSPRKKKHTIPRKWCVNGARGKYQRYTCIFMCYVASWHILSYEKVGSDLESYMLWCIQIQPKKTQAILKTTPIINYKVSLPEDSWKPTSRNWFCT